MIGAAVSRAIQHVDPDLAVFDVRPLDQRVYDTVWQRRMAGSLSLCFGGLALLLAGIGCYGVLSFLVSQRTREIGIRQALGSPPGAIWLMVVKEGLTLAALGIAAGLAISLAVGRLAGGLLYGVAAHDAGVYSATVAVVLAFSVTACSVPAWRASRVSPSIALRSD